MYIFELYSIGKIAVQFLATVVNQGGITPYIIFPLSSLRVAFMQDSNFLERGK